MRKFIRAIYIILTTVIALTFVNILIMPKHRRKTDEAY